MEGRDEREGRVEVFLDGQWGTVCGDLWEDTATMVVCNQLNFYHKGQSKILIVDHSIYTVSRLHYDAGMLCCFGSLAPVRSWLMYSTFNFL